MQGYVRLVALRTAWRGRQQSRYTGKGTAFKPCRAYSIACDNKNRNHNGGCLLFHLSKRKDDEKEKRQSKGERYRLKHGITHRIVGK